MKQNNTVVTLALLGALALAAIFGVLFSADNVIHAQEPPVFAEPSPTLTVDENTPPGTNIEAPVSATDPDGDTLTYSLGGTNAALFAVDPSTGQLITKAALDAEATPSYSVQVTATDRDTGTNDATANVQINVTDVNELPLAPAAPTVTSGSSGTETLEVQWDAPDNTGREGIDGYDVQYKKVTETDFSEPADAGNDRRHTISDLEAGTAYHVRVRAKNTDTTDNTGPWSLVGTGQTNAEGNSAPTFTTSTATVNVPENTPAGQNVGARVAASDTDSTTLDYSLEGADKDSFDIVSTSGQILTKAPLNHEAKASYNVLVKVVDGDGGSAVASRTITVTNLQEPASAPSKPTAVAGEDNDSTPADESTTTLKVTWDAPANTGPAITDNGNDTSYNVQYREGTIGAFGDTGVGTVDKDGRSVTIESESSPLKPGTSYQVRVQANNGEGLSPWSATGEGSTNQANRAPEFSGATATRSVAENTPANRTIGRPVAATDRDRDTVTYSLEGDDAGSFAINESTGQILTKLGLNYEAACGDGNTGSDDAIREANENECNYLMMVKAEDPNGGSATIAVTISVTDVGEVPSAPDRPTVTSVADDSDTADLDESATRLKVTWDAPENRGPHVTGYEVQYRVQGRGSFVPVTDTINMEDRTVTITGLTAGQGRGIEYEVQVRATNAEGTGLWSASGRGSTNTPGNSLPSFSQSGPIAVDLLENTPAGTNVGQPLTATDSENDVPLTYSLEGADRVFFGIDSSTGQITTKTGVTYNHEVAKNSYSLIIKVEDNRDGSRTIQVNITVTDDEASNAPEVPEAPDAPTVAVVADDEKTKTVDESTTSLDVSWNKPENTGPPIHTYTLQYRVKESGDAFTDSTEECDGIDGDAAEKKCFEDRMFTLTGLEDGTTYEVQVNAASEEGTSPFSLPGLGTTVEANNRPEFSSGVSATRSVPENTRSGQNVGAPMTATDRDGDRRTYTIEGPGAESFTIDSSTGQIRTRAALDYESRSSYSVTVKADDRTGTRTSFAAISVTVMVTDVGEPPSRPAAPRIAGVVGSSNSIRVTWEAPANSGPPITDFDVQYRAGSSGTFRSWPHFGMDLNTIITGLNASLTYQVQVLANNAEGPGDWSGSGSGMPDPDPANNPPTFSGGARAFDVPENSGGGINIGTPITATDRDRDTLTYSLEGTDAANFEIVSASGQIQTKADVDYNHEAKERHSVTVKAVDGRGGSDTVAVTIRITDVDGEAPETPDAPTVRGTASSNTSIDVSWEAPENAGPRITDYDVQYRPGNTGRFIDWGHTGSGTTARIDALEPDTEYEVQVLAKNPEGDSGWSESGMGSTNPNRPPAFDAASTMRNVFQSAEAGTPIGLPVTATDPDNDELTYSIEGADRNSFDIEPDTGQLLTRAGVTLDADTKATYTVKVLASDGIASAEITVTITVGTNNAPVFPSNENGRRSVVENSDTRTNVGAPVTATDQDPGDTLEYTLDGADAALFTIVAETGQIQTAVVLDQEARYPATNASYTVTVTAIDPSGDRDTITVTITVTDVTFGCATEGAVTDTTNRGLVSDCEALREARDKLEDGGARLNWTESTPIDRWQGIKFGGSPTRVTKVNLKAERLSGTLPAELGDLSMLTELNLRSNRLTGSIPAKLNDLANLKVLNLHSNTLSGPIPDLGDTMLEQLYLANNYDENVAGSGLTGGVPAWLNDMTDMKDLWLWGNMLTGTIPDLSGMTSLEKLKLAGNNLTGGIPEASRLPANLTWLILQENQLGGTIPRLSGLTSLRTLWLHTNGLTGDASSLGTVTTLTNVNLRDNNLSGIGDLSDLDSLQILYLQGNQLTMIPSTLGDLDSLRRLWLHENLLTGIDEGLENAADTLTHLYLKDNPFGEDACLPGDLETSVANNDFAEAGLEACNGN